jgi:DnaJ-class molecular chaperone
MSSSLDDPYQLLGVSRDASVDQIKSAYHKLARKLHPDLNPGNRQSEEKFKKVASAYDLLSDSVKRKRYDDGEIDANGLEKGFTRQNSRPSSHQARRNGWGSDSFTNAAEDIFNDLLRRRERARESQAHKGNDSSINLQISLEEAIRGTTKKITLPNGKSLNIKVPPQCENGKILRLKGQGQAGPFGGFAGDALVSIQIVETGQFTKQNDDILTNLPITLGEAILGCKVPVETLEGQVVITIPPHSNTDTVLRLKGKGITGSSGKKGDQLITLKVVLPTKIDTELEEFIQHWSAKHSYKVR